MRAPSPTAIGAFVLGALVLAVAGAIALGGGNFLTSRLAAVSFFEGSVKGLQVGAPVTFRGVAVGSVTELGLRVNPETLVGTVQVTMELVPDTVETFGARLPHEGAEFVPALVSRGLTAKLVAQSLVTGQLMVELDFRPDTRARRHGFEEAGPEIPTVASDLEILTEQIMGARLDDVVRSVHTTFATLNELLSDPALRRAVSALPSLAERMEGTLDRVDAEVASLSAAARAGIVGASGDLRAASRSVVRLAGTAEREISGTSAALRGTLGQTSAAMARIDAFLDPRSRLMTQAQRSADDVAAAADRFRNLAERLDRDPSILIRGR